MVLAVGLDIARRRYFTVGAGAKRGADEPKAK
jgi:hypothetical protein